MFVDASAWTAILANESEREAFETKLASAPKVLSSAIAAWETVRAVSRIVGGDGAEIQALAEAYWQDFNVRFVPIGEAEYAMALAAHTRFGKGVHPAKLNMGDCFAYACARTNNVPLLFKGDDFSLTDIEPA